MLRWRLEMVDTWFFREARSHDAVGVGQLYSDFPPPIGTLYGAIRTYLGDCLGVSWDTFAQEQAEHYALLGDGERLGAVQIAAVQLARGDEVLYPAPADLLKKAHAEGSGFAVMRLTVRRCCVIWVMWLCRSCLPGRRRGVSRWRRPGSRQRACSVGWRVRCPHRRRW